MVVPGVTKQIYLLADLNIRSSNDKKYFLRIFTNFVKKLINHTEFKKKKDSCLEVS